MVVAAETAGKTASGPGLVQGHRKVDDAVEILLVAYSGEERLTMKSRLFV